MRRFGIALLLALVVLPGCTSSRRQRPPRDRASKIVDAPLSFVFLDLGQADSMMVIYRGKVLLMDAGESRTDEERQTCDGRRETSGHERASPR